MKTTKTVRIAVLVDVDVTGIAPDTITDEFCTASDEMNRQIAGNSRIKIVKTRLKNSTAVTAI